MQILRPLIPASLILLAPPSIAQSWFEYSSLVDRFSVNFPAEPAIEEFDYYSEFDAIFSARRYTVGVGSSGYSVTVVDFRDSEKIHAEMEKTEAASGMNVWINDQRASVAKAAREFRQRDGKVTYDAWSHIDLVEGHQLQITNVDGSRTFAGIYLHGNASRLYILESTVAPGSPPPGQFQQSLRFLDDDGQRIRYQLSPNGSTVDLG